MHNWYLGAPFIVISGRGDVRQYLRGWYASKSCEDKKEKREILSKLEDMDRWLETQGGMRLYGWKDIS
jgi:hypothetical protein